MDRSILKVILVFAYLSLSVSTQIVEKGTENILNLCINSDKLNCEYLFQSEKYPNYSYYEKNEDIGRSIWNFVQNFGSSHSIHSDFSLPSSQTSFSCSWCSIQSINPHEIISWDVSLFDEDNTGVLASSSQWSSFFSKMKSGMFEDQYKIKGRNPLINSSPPPSLIFSKPVVFLPMIAFHVGHFYLDVFEQLFSLLSSLNNNENEINTNTILAIRSGNQEEDNVMFSKLMLMVDDSSSPFSLLKFFSSQPIHTIKAIEEEVLKMRGSDKEEEPNHNNHHILFPSIHTIGKRS